MLIVNRRYFLIFSKRFNDKNLWLTKKKSFEYKLLYPKQKATSKFARKNHVYFTLILHKSVQKSKIKDKTMGIENFVAAPKFDATKFKNFVTVTNSMFMLMLTALAIFFAEKYDKRRKFLTLFM